MPIVISQGYLEDSIRQVWQSFVDRNKPQATDSLWVLLAHPHGCKLAQGDRIWQGSQARRGRLGNILSGRGNY